MDLYEALNASAGRPMSAEVEAALIKAIYGLCRAVVRTHNFPPLPPAHRWDQDAMDELVHDFFAARPIGERLAVLLAGARNTATLVAGLEASLVRHIQGELRKTSRGSVARTVSDALSDQRFRREGSFVALAAWPPTTDPWQGDTDVLSRAAASVEVTVPPWSGTSTRRAPVADRQSLVAICEACLDAARCPVEFSTLLDVILNRCGASGIGPVEPLDETSQAKHPLTDDDAHAAARAGEIWSGLTTSQQHAVAVLGDSVREAGEYLEVGKSRAAEVIKELRLVLAAQLMDEDDPRKVLRALVERCARSPDG